MTMERIGIMQDYISSDKRQRKADTLRAESREVAATRQSIRARLQRDAALAWMELAMAGKPSRNYKNWWTKVSARLGFSGAVSAAAVRCPPRCWTRT